MNELPSDNVEAWGLNDLGETIIFIRHKSPTQTGQYFNHYLLDVNRLSKKQLPLPQNFYPRIILNNRSVWQMSGFYSEPNDFNARRVFNIERSIRNFGEYWVKLDRSVPLNRTNLIKGINQGQKIITIGENIFGEKHAVLLIPERM